MLSLGILRKENTGITFGTTSGIICVLIILKKWQNFIENTVEDASFNIHGAKSF